jgi:DNA-binding PucR family transcriptional regulator
VHRNTYFYRMNKVRELFYLDLKDGEDRLDVAFSALIMEGLGERLMFDRASVPSEFAG